uniref:PRKR-interacting protein 1 n=1 Tax=Pyramimonas obovata TaxID=1411642 RepID=A0A7S0RV27_9CHLO|mmetsp:Transcript_7159/g.14520  ORF Transcript_7159/g.14520 Transcript_7159/m.14520 type:complete len:166 (+) Transcript_7159:287-784(+)|eukprot:CAMPEP_0118921660 /NCGR_PEP_ID=MMETSP1169-20130426/867_1 /TAXON_ID=36882 /ORGANISM="Pyramimonas obovata, Strain CCMP722" /LENGTH=165 /DNA_ID=CAMNT_0006862421 /DNA_START=284 /DNA_END=781 /DNA_ORIENTATION=+
MPKYTTGQSYSEHNAQIVPMPEVPKEEEAPADNCADLEAKLRWINDKVPLKEGNIMGSQAGAGSGDFHMYRMARRREQFRWQRIEEEDAKRQDEEAFLERKAKREAECEGKTAKNRAKRQKKKEKQKSKKNADGTTESNPEGVPGEGGNCSDDAGQPDAGQPDLD